MAKTITLAMTGASGAAYGLRLLELLLKSHCRVHFLLSDAAEVVVRQEVDESFPHTAAEQKQWLLARTGLAAEQRLHLYRRRDWFAPVASGSARLDAMVICPASGGTLSAVATGASNNLVERAADVALKERRQLILVPRETPYSEIHLENMLKLTRMGAVVLPASPGFYYRPTQIADLVDFVVARILDHLAIDQAVIPQWGASEAD